MTEINTELRDFAKAISKSCIEHTRGMTEINSEIGRLATALKKVLVCPQTEMIRSADLLALRG